MDIVVKSFNRPFYLERCLRSIERYVTGTYTVRILDDGTPAQYLRRIQELFPHVKIAHSPRYEQKAAALHRHVAGEGQFDERIIPISFWKAQIEECTDIFLLLEDDIWLIEPLDLDFMAQQMRQHRLATIKLSWLGNPRLVPGRRLPLAENLEELVPEIPLATRLVFLNELRVRSVLFRLGLLRFFKPDLEYQLPLYALYSVASAFFDKSYWLHLWEDSQVSIDEAQQLRRAVQWQRQHRPRFAKSQREVTKTSFITSATNMFAGVDFDVFRFSYHLNQAWLRGELDAMRGFPRDLPEDYLRTFLEAAHDPRTTYSEWTRWTGCFKAQYQRLGCQTE
ncbi:glycosyltransferase family protein [Hymenobacter ruricola]|uniref:Glycosyltransferase n=1 Tax=Hymenobacter ruricola TaxID=2791023 RepID=A0ABS0I5E6_9BACT|nr:glycosyltransferase [Hymenobacter ruricola]MBF9222155.1 glycosyltransferase [Hymenobacter ruricola]